MKRGSWIFALLLFLVPALALAQPRKKTLRDELPPAAQASYDDAVQSMKQTPPEYDRASAKFQQAYETSHNPRVLNNVAVCERNLQHYARAAAIFKQELAEGSGKLSAQEKADVQASIAALDRYISSIELTVSEPDASVFLDNFKVGTTPIATIPADVSSTPHQLRIEKDGFVPFEKGDVLVNSTTPVRISAELEPKDKSTEVDITVSGASGASIWIDNIDRGPAPFKGMLKIGPHTFEARQPGFETNVQTQEVFYKKTLTLDLPLARIAPSKLHIDTIDGAIIEVNGRVVGSTSWEGPVDVGVVTVNARKDGYNPASIEVQMGKGQSLSRRIPLTAEKKNDWVFWTVGSVLVIAGATVAAAFVFSPSNQAPVFGTLDPTLIRASHGVHF